MDKDGERGREDDLIAKMRAMKGAEHEAKPPVKSVDDTDFAGEYDLAEALNCLANAYYIKDLAQERLSRAEWQKYKTKEAVSNRGAHLSNEGLVSGSNAQAQKDSVRCLTEAERLTRDDAVFAYIMCERDFKIASDAVRHLREALELLRRG
jgi:hypothetical protein